MQALKIDPNRFRRDFDRLSEIGATDGGGVHRPALGEAHLAARSWFRGRIEADGLEVREDSAGNLGARLSSRRSGARTLLLGSHLDSVPDGGRFDGALGTLAAYESLRAVRDANLELPVHLEAIDFTDEEGTLVGLLGSRALAGTLDPTELSTPRGGRKALESALARAGLSEEGIPRARRDPATLAGFLELHIEQGPRLHDARVQIGIVSAIAGIASFEMTFEGRADHAGTTPMDSRRDAGVAAARFVAEATDLVIASFAGSVVNFGRIGFVPGAFNIVPGAATVAVECRASDAKTLARLTDELIRTASKTAARQGVETTLVSRGTIAPMPCAPSIQRAFEQSARKLGLSQRTLVSGAGHDTMALAEICPAGMIFVPSTGGSHSPREHCAFEDCVNGANVLLSTAVGLALPARASP